MGSKIGIFWQSRVDFCFASFILTMHGCVAPKQCVLSDNEMITWFIYVFYLDHLQMPLDLAAALSMELSLQNDMYMD